MTENNDFFEIDFLDVETAKSGDSITIRTRVGGIETVSVVDGGYAECGQKIIDHIKKYYGSVPTIQHVVLTHPDGDHAAGLKTVLEEYPVERLWMNRPWLYATTLLPNYPTYNSLKALESRLKKKYPHVAELEKIALSMGVLIEEAFQGNVIGNFTVMSPTFNNFINLILKDDDKAEEFEETASVRFDKYLLELAKSAISYVSSIWGHENLPEKDTSPRNEMTIVQYGKIAGKKILLTGDVGREGLQTVIDYAPSVGLDLPGIDRFQVPHHGSRRNVSSEILNQLLGPVKSETESQQTHFTAVISSAAKDVHHPKKAVVRAMIHRGAKVVTTEGHDVRSHMNAPVREGWTSLNGLNYPTEQEE
ncbi:ComEC/Rec2 family competence protein [Croceicoccus mobilis]|uniref:MBL fold hydrolase n=1 Tax=Croceicoccus mobilis TaxID=1703339 RepID=A0A916YXV6_9SPHN|nr:MBL fold metallo-hydrolase [Croceicoccus mobilis]GGD66207.1 MBL fold hydrolase [Croceicoccus mobilis]